MFPLVSSPERRVETQFVMPTVYIPSLLKSLTGGKSQLEVLGSTVREVIENLEKSYPGIKGRLVENGQLRANISIAVDGEITPLGLIEGVGKDSEIHFVAAIKGGSARAVPETTTAGVKATRAKTEPPA